MIANSGHDFSKISILHEQDLLRPLVMTYPMPEVMAMPTEILPYMELASQLKEILNQLSELVLNFRD
jgi:hypothetical protein